MMTTDKERKYRTIQKRTGNTNKRLFYLGFRRRSSDRNGENRERQRSEHQSTTLTILPSLYTRKKTTFIAGQIFRNRTRTDRIGRVCLENYRRRKTVKLTTLHPPSELIPSTFLSLIGRSAKDYELETIRNDHRNSKHESIYCTNICMTG